MMKESRSSNFELLRIFLILFVIVLHYNSPYRHGAFSFIDSAPLYNKFFLYSLEALALGAVNVFLCLSGYFLSSRNSVTVRKVVNLFTVLIAYNVISYLAGTILGGSPSVKGLLYCLGPANYFVWLYSAVYLLSPFLNLVFRHASDKQLNTFMAILLILFSVIPTLSDFVLPSFLQTKMTISAISIYGNGNGYTVTNFIMMYYIGGYIAHRKISWGKAKSAAGYLICTAIICAMMFINSAQAISYCNIAVILQAVSLFLLFRNFSFKSRIINSVARSVWGIYIMHSSFVTLYVKNHPFSQAAPNTITYLAAHFAICIAATFLCALLWDKVCGLLLRPIHLLFDRTKCLNKEISLSKF